jgi:hypothetical protein
MAMEKTGAELDLDEQMKALADEFSLLLNSKTMPTPHYAGKVQAL